MRGHHLTNPRGNTLLLLSQIISPERSVGATIVPIISRCSQVVWHVIWVHEIGGSIPPTSTINNMKVGESMQVKEAAEKLGMNTQTLRLALQQKLFPFGVAVKTSKNRFTYYVNPNRLEKYLEGVDNETTYNLDDVVGCRISRSNRT